MKSSLPIFAVVMAGSAVACLHLHAQTPAAQATKSLAAAPIARTAHAAAPAAQVLSGDALLRRVLAAVDAQASISARLRYKVELMGRSTVGSGSYLQQGRGPERKLRLELKLQTRSLPSMVWHVSDGLNLWIMEEFAGDKRLARVDVARLRQARPRTGGALPGVDGWMALGGLPKMLAGLDAAFVFGPVRESRLDEVRVWTLVGTWEPARLADLLPGQKDAILAGQPVNFEKLSPQLPTTAVIHVGYDDFFPYRVEYWRATDGAVGAAPVTGGTLLAVMEFYEVRFGGPIDPKQFAFEPPQNLAADDRTPAFLEMLGLEEATPTGAKPKAEPRR
jgi:hypothetical protein